LGENGIIQAADQHACAECTQEYKHNADIISNNQNPAAVVGIDEHTTIPELVGPEIQLALAEEAQSANQSSATANNDHMEVDENLLKSFVQLVVVDGLVFGPPVSKYIVDIQLWLNYL
jgi:hypothetical protein